MNEYHLRTNTLQTLPRSSVLQTPEQLPFFSPHPPPKPRLLLSNPQSSKTFHQTPNVTPPSKITTDSAPNPPSSYPLRRISFILHLVHNTHIPNLSIYTPPFSPPPTPFHYNPIFISYSNHPTPLKYTPPPPTRYFQIKKKPNIISKRDGNHFTYTEFRYRGGA